jgi:hypothetical protein
MTGASNYTDALKEWPLNGLLKKLNEASAHSTTLWSNSVTVDS